MISSIQAANAIQPLHGLRRTSNPLLVPRSTVPGVGARTYITHEFGPQSSPHVLQLETSVAGVEHPYRIETEAQRRDRTMGEMSSTTVRRGRMAFVHRFRCARIGHYWADDGTGKHGVCVRCGKHGAPVSRYADLVRPPADVAAPRVAAPARAPQTPRAEPVQPPVAATPQPAVRPEPPGVGAITIAAVSIAVVGGAAYVVLRNRTRRKH